MISWYLGAASPFSSWEEFEGAIDGPTGGAIYTFADRPALNGIMLVVAALIFLYFIYASFHIKSGSSSAKSPPVLGLLLVAGAASAMTTLYEGVTEQQAGQRTAHSELSQTTKASRRLPIALLGMTGIAGVSKRKRAKSLRRRLRSR